MVLNVNLIIEKEKFIIEYLKTVDNILNNIIPKRETTQRKRKSPSVVDELILKAAWVTINRNAIWYLTNYRRSINSVPVTPISECSFACRLIMETAADCRYYLLGDDKLKKYFLKEYNGFKNNFDVFWGKLGDKNYSRINDYVPPKSTISRIESCFGKDGVGHYQILCWSTHFSYIGYEVLKMDLGEGFNYKIRMNGLIYILGSLNSILKTLFDINLLRDDSFKNRIAKSNKMMEDLKEEILDNE